MVRQRNEFATDRSRHDRCHILDMRLEWNRVGYTHKFVRMECMERGHLLLVESASLQVASPPRTSSTAFLCNRSRDVIYGKNRLFKATCK